MVILFARDGVRELAVFTALFSLLGAVSAIYFIYALPVPLILLAFTLYFFRDPERDIQDTPGIFIAPADGTVSDISEAKGDDYIDGTVLKIGIFMSVFSVHINRSPFKGRVTKTIHSKGLFLNALRHESADLNENNITYFVNDDTGIKFKVRQIAGIIARRIVCNAAEGVIYSAGDRFGMIKFGSRTELYLSKNSIKEITVKVGDSVYAGITPLLRISEEYVPKKEV